MSFSLSTWYDESLLKCAHGQEAASTSTNLSIEIKGGGQGYGAACEVLASISYSPAGR